MLSSWTSAPGEVVSAEVYSNVDHVSNPPVALFGFRCMVSFIEQGRSRLAPLDFGSLSSNPNEAERWYQRFPKGSQIRIVFDPSDPGRLRFAGDYQVSYLGPIRALQLAGWLLLAGVPAVMMSKRQLGNGEPEVGS